MLRLLMWAQHFYFRFSNTAAIIGAPTKAVTLLTGKAPSKPGRRERMQQRRVREMPETRVAGISQRWSEVRKTARARCGTASPTNIIGPQYAVTTAARSPDEIITIMRERRMFNPRFRA